MAEARNRHDLLYLAKLAEQAERYQEMVDYMKKLAALHTELNYEERSYFSVAYKDLVGTRRTSWRTLASTLRKEEAQGNRDEVEMIERYRKRIEDELTVDCLDCIATVEEHLMPYSQTSVSQIFWHKMIGDHHRYLAEFSNEAQRKTSYDAAYDTYNIGLDMVRKELVPTHPLRLGMQLSFAVYYFEIRKKPQIACDMAQQAFDEGISRLETLTEENYRDSTLLMQLLRDNMMMWKAQMEEEAEEQDDAQQGYSKEDEEYEKYKEEARRRNTEEEEARGNVERDNERSNEHDDEVNDHQDVDPPLSTDEEPDNEQNKVKKNGRVASSSTASAEDSIISPVPESASTSSH